MHNHNCESVGEGQFIMTTVYNYITIGAFLPINPSPTTVCVCHSGFLIVSEYFPDDWCINYFLMVFLGHSVDISITFKTIAIDTPGRNLSLVKNIKAQTTALNRAITY